MQLHNLKPKTKNKKSRQVGRGGKRGKTSGRGMKGQKARAGRKLRPEVRDLIKRLPKKRGYRFKSFQIKPVIISLQDIEDNFSSGEEVSPDSLSKKNLITRKDLAIGVKVLSDGKLTKKIVLSGCLFSSSAKSAIENAGGEVK